MDSKHFDKLRSEVESLGPMMISSAHATIEEILIELINGQEKIWNKLTSSPVDIADHDDEGRVKMEDED